MDIYSENPQKPILLKSFSTSSLSSKVDIMNKDYPPTHLKALKGEQQKTQASTH